MAPFTFRLQTLLKLREAARDGERQRYSEALAAEAELAAREAAVAQALDELREFARRANQGAVDVNQLVHAQRYRLLLQADAQEAAQQRGQLEQELERRRAALVEADRNVRILEKLRETQNTRHRAAEERREQNVLDEVAARRHATGDER